jgi:hypothetical protein
MKWLLPLSLIGLVGCGADLAAEEWPQLRPGVWRIAIRATANDGAPALTTSEERYCSGTMFLFQRYPRVGVIDKKGCRFESERKGAVYEVINVCAVVGAGEGVTKGLVSVRSDREFDSTWETRQGGKIVMREELKGTWAGACKD